MDSNRDLARKIEAMEVKYDEQFAVVRQALLDHQVRRKGAGPDPAILPAGQAVRLQTGEAEAGSHRLPGQGAEGKVVGPLAGVVAADAEVDGIGTRSQGSAEAGPVACRGDELYGVVLHAVALNLGDNSKMIGVIVTFEE
jgi:hypothetical protein